MSLFDLLIAPAHAQATQPAPGGLFGGGMSGLLFPIILLAIMYFLMIRPQQRRLKEHRDMVASIRRGDTVVTAGGIVGKVAKVEDQEVQVEIADNVKIKVLRSTISEVRGKGEGAPAGKAKAASG